MPSSTYWSLFVHRSIKVWAIYRILYKEYHFVLGHVNMFSSVSSTTLGT